jgi:hypothetical protein
MHVNKVSENVITIPLIGQITISQTIFHDEAILRILETVELIEEYPLVFVRSGYVIKLQQKVHV